MFNGLQKKNSDNLFQWKTFSFYFHTVMSNEFHCIVVHQLKSSHLHSVFFSHLLLFRKLRKLKTNDKYKWQMTKIWRGQLRINRKCRTTQVSKVQNTSKSIFWNKIVHLRIHSNTFHRVITKQKHTTHKHTYIIQDTQWNNKVNKNIYHR